MEQQEHQKLEKPINGFVRNLKNTNSQEEEASMSHHYALRENPKKKTHKSPVSMKKNVFSCGECGKEFSYEKCPVKHEKAHEEEEERVKKSLCSSFGNVTKKKRSSVNRCKKTTLAVFAASEEELEVAESLILLSMSSPKSEAEAEAIDASYETPQGSYDPGCLRSKKLRKGVEFESGVFGNEQELMEERVSNDETSKERASFLRNKQKQGETGEYDLGFMSNEHKMVEEGISNDETLSFLGHKVDLDQQKLRKGGEFRTGISSNEGEPDSELGGVGDMECSDSKNVTETNEENLEYQCKLCKKIFSSYQALGGHQTSHRMSKSKSKKHSW